MEDKIGHYDMDELYNEHVGLFYDLQKYNSSISYTFHEIFEGNYTPVKVINSSNFEGVSYP
jgi:hypothetical protein